MPKERRTKRSSFDQSTPSPYSRNSKNADKNKSNTQSVQVENEKEWREARCPVCMEHPHNAVLLICSSHEKGCCPYMCDTSHRHSNCLDQFLKLAKESSIENQSARHPVRRDQPNLVCPLCRGKISTWVVMKPARQFMNAKRRSCSMETCDFVGNYSELRKHARSEHPYVHPMEMDPTRQRDWERSERQTAMQDLISAMETGDGFEYEEDEEGGGGGRSSPVGQFDSVTTIVAEVEVRRSRRRLLRRSIREQIPIMSPLLLGFHLWSRLSYEDRLVISEESCVSD